MSRHAAPPSPKKSSNATRGNLSATISVPWPLRSGHLESNSWSVCVCLFVIDTTFQLQQIAGANQGAEEKGSETALRSRQGSHCRCRGCKKQHFSSRLQLKLKHFGGKKHMFLFAIDWRFSKNISLICKKQR